MADIIEIKSKKKTANDLNALLKNANILRSKIDEIKKDNIAIFNKEKFINLMAGLIADVLIKKKMIEREIFLCQIYISNLLASFIIPPKSYYIIDYLLEYADREQPICIQRGADICFMINSVFTERGRHRSMTPNDYEEIGRGLYYQYYGITKSEIGFYMSKHFKEMAKITNYCFKSISKQKTCC